MHAHAQFSSIPSEADSAPHLRLELPESVLYRLLSKGHLYAVEFRCLDAASHQQVRQLLLRSCLERLRYLK